MATTRGISPPFPAPVADAAGRFTRPWTLFLTQVAQQVFVPITVANLPATGPTGAVATVTDSTTQVWGAPVAGGGAFTVLVWFNGTAWTVLGM